MPNATSIVKLKLHLFLSQFGRFSWQANRGECSSKGTLTEAKIPKQRASRSRRCLAYPKLETISEMGVSVQRVYLRFVAITLSLSHLSASILLLVSFDFREESRRVPRRLAVNPTAATIPCGLYHMQVELGFLSNPQILPI